MGLFFFNFHFLILLVRNCRIRNCQHFVSVHYLLPVVSVHFNMAYTRAMPFNYSFKKKIDMRSHVFVAGSFIWLIMLTCFLFEVTLSDSEKKQILRSFFNLKGSQKTQHWTRERTEGDGSKFSRVWNMPAGIMIPARNMPSMIGRNGTVGGFGLSSGLSLGHVSNFFISFSSFLLLLPSLEFLPIFVTIGFWFWWQFDWCVVRFAQFDFYPSKRVFVF